MRRERGERNRHANLKDQSVGPTSKQTEKLRKLEWLKTSNLTENRDTAGSVSKFDISKLKDFHNAV